MKEQRAEQMFTLRAAREEDAGIIRKLVHIGQINPTGLNWERFTVAEAPNRQVIGCGQIKPHGDGSEELASLVVHPDWRGRGVARAIIEHFHRLHPGDLYLMCRAEMGAMYEKYGYRELAPDEMPRYFQRILRLLGFLGRIGGEREGVLIMKREGDS